MYRTTLESLQTNLTLSRRAWMCCLLCVCTWRGPIPIVHEHSLDLAALGGNSSLALHAFQFHADELGHGESDWHVHFVMPRELFPLGGGNDTCLPMSDEPSMGWSAATVFGSVSQSLWELNRAGPLLLGSNHAPMLVRGMHKNPPLQVPWNGFLQSVCGCADSRSVLCVALC